MTAGDNATGPKVPGNASAGSRALVRADDPSADSGAPLSLADILPDEDAPAAPARPTAARVARATGGHTASRHPLLQGERPSSAVHSSAPAGAPVHVRPGDVAEGLWRWRLTSELGTGGYGTVWRAEREEDGAVDAPASVAAVKFFRPPAGIDAGHMMRRELAALLAMRSDRIPRVLDHGVEGPAPFLAMQYLAHGSTFDLGQRKGPLAPEAIWRLLLDLLEALRIAHHAAVLHLDIKPGNVLLDGQGGFVLTDFGISQGSYVSGYVGAVGLGTRGYQSPEQRERAVDALDVRTDLWGVGATAWALLTGIDPSRQLQHLRATPDPKTRAGLPPPSTLVSGVPAALDHAILQLVAYDPVDRPGGAAEALALVRRLVSGHSRPLSTAIELRGRVDVAEAEALIADLYDPLWQAICGSDGASDFLVRYEDGELLCREGERSHHAFALLRGVVRIERAGKLLTTIDREGTFLGEVATLTGASRTATMRAQGRVWAMLFNAAELEHFVVANPPVALRLLHSLAAALDRESRRKA